MLIIYSNIQERAATEAIKTDTFQNQAAGEASQRQLGIYRGGPLVKVVQ